MKTAQRFNLLAALVRVALVAALAAAVWGVYRHLPHDDATPASAREEQGGATLLRIRLRRSDGAMVRVLVPVRGSEAEAAETAAQFAAQVAPRLAPYVPN